MRHTTGIDEQDKKATEINAGRVRWSRVYSGIFLSLRRLLPELCGRIRDIIILIAKSYYLKFFQYLFEIWFGLCAHAFLKKV